MAEVPKILKGVRVFIGDKDATDYVMRKENMGDVVYGPAGHGRAVTVASLTLHEADRADEPKGAASRMVASLIRPIGSPCNMMLTNTQHQPAAPLMNRAARRRAEKRKGKP